MDNKKRTLIIDTFDDLISMNGDVYDTQKLTVKYASCKFSAEYVRDILATLHNLEWFEIQNPDGKLCSIDGMLYSRNGKLLYFCPRQRKGTVIIPDGTETICQNAFSVTQISELIIPASVKRLQKFACGDNNLLKRVIGGEGIVSFGQYAFYNCVRLTEFNLGKNVKFIGNSAFANTELKTIDLPEGLKSVGDGAFHTTHITEDNYMVEVEPDGMYEIHIPNSLRKIGLCAFSNASVVYTETVTRKLLMPKSFSCPKEAATALRDFINTENAPAPTMYTYNSDCAGLAAAIEHCKLYSDTKSKMFITRNISTIMYNVFHTEPDGEQFMIGLIKDGVLTDTALRKMLSKMDKDTYLKNAVILKAYVINALSDIKCNFEL